jgi:PAS domain-containing protein
MDLKSALSFASTDVVSWEYKLATKQFTYVSKQAEQFLGYPVEQWYDEGFWENHIHPKDRNEAVQYCVSHSERKLDHQFRYRMLKSNGDIVLGA